MIVSLIVAMDDNGSIGLADALPWPHNPEDMKWFRQVTMGKVCITGWNTAQTLPPLKGREVVVMGRHETPEQIIGKYPDREEIVVIGGRKTYLKWLPYVTRFHIGRIRGIYPADTHLRELKVW